MFDSAVGLHGDVFTAQIPQIIQVFAHAADVVARQFAQTAVFVETAHFHICHRGMLHEHNSVAADAIVGAAQTDAQGLRGGDAAVKVLDEDIVVAGAVHLGEGDFPPPQPHGVDVHQLGVALVVAAEGHVGQSLSGVQGGQAGNAQLHGLPMQGNVVTHGGILHRSGVDDVAQLPGLHQGVNPVAFRGVGHGGNRNAQGGNGLGGAFCGIEGQTQIIEPLGQGDHFRVVSGLHAEQHPGGFAGVQVRHGEACGGESLEHGLPQGPADAQHFAGGLHLGTQNGVGVVELFKGEYRHLYRIVGGCPVQSIPIAQLRQPGAQHDPGSQVHHGHSGDLADVGHGAGGPGIDLDDVQLILVDQVLDVHQPFGAHGQGQLPGTLADPVEKFVAEIVGGINGDGVTAVNACPLDMLHDAGNQHVLPVRDYIHFQLGAGHIFVDEHRIVNASGEDPLHIPLCLLRTPGDGHVLPADDVGGPQQHRVAKLPGGFQSLGQGVDPPAPGTADAEVLQQVVKPGPVLRQIDAVGAGAQNGDSLAVQVLGELDGGLTAESYHHAHWLLHLENVHHILPAQRFKVEPVGGIVVGGDGLRVVVDDDHIIAHFLEGPDAVNTAVVKFNALADSDGAGAQHHNHRFPTPGHGPGFAVGIKAGIEVGGLGVEFRSAGVHHFVGHGKTGQFPAAAEPGQRLVGIAQKLSLPVKILCHGFPGENLFILCQILELVQKPPVNFGNGVDFFYGNPCLQGLKHGKQPMIVLLGQPLHDRCIAQGGGVQGVQGDFRSPDGLHQSHLKGGGDGHDLAGGFHLGAQLPAGTGEFVKGPLGNLHHHIVQGGLKAGAGFAGDVVGNLIQGVAQGNPGADLGDGVARGFGSQGRGPGHPGVDLNHGIFKAVRIQCELAVAAAHNADFRDDVQGRAAKHLIFLVRQGQGWGHHNGVAGVNAHRVEILHGAHGNHVSRSVPDGFKLNFLPAGDAPLHQNLVNGGQGQTVVGDDGQFLRSGSNAAAAAAQGIGRADNDGVADFFCNPGGFFQSFGSGGGNHRLTHGRQGFPELLPVLGLFNCLNGRAQ